MKRTKVFPFSVLLWCLLFWPSSSNCEIHYYSDSTGYWRLEDYITTHYTSTGGDNEIGGEIETGVWDVYYGADSDDTWKNREKHSYPFDESKRPFYNNYFNQITADKLVTFNEIQVFEQEVYQDTGRHVDILNYDPNTNLWGYLFVAVPNVQIINNIPHGTSLFTVVLPPYWQGSPPTRYPVLLRGMGYLSDNNGIYTTMGAFQRVKWVANSVNIGPGLIVIFANTGGRESQGVHSNAFDDVGSFLNLLTNFPVGGGQSWTVDFGLNLDKMVANGGSRGGSTALAWGANPVGYSYEALGIHADVPPLKLGSMLRRSFYAFPGLNNAVNEALGSDDAYLYSYTDSQSGQTLTPDKKALATGNVFVGGVDFGGIIEDEIDRIDSLSAYGICADSKSSLTNKRVTTSLGTHDAYTSMADFLDFDNMLNDDPNAVPHKAYIGYMWGHGYVDRLGVCDQYGCYPDSYASVFRLLKGQDLPPYANQRIFEMPDCQRDQYGQCAEPITVNWAEGRRINSQLIDEIRAIHAQDALKDYFPPTHDPSQLGFSATVPSKVVRHNPNTIVLMGQEGKTWEIYARPEDGYHPLYQATGTFGTHTGRQEEVEWGNEWVVMQYEIGAAVGKYEWFFMYDGKEIPNRFTPWVSNGAFAKTVTDVLSEELDSENGYYHDYRDTELINFGVDEYHVLLLASNQDPVIDYIPDKYASVGQTLSFTITATDPDGDDLVYDVRNTAGNLYNTTVNLNGLTGEFSFTPKPAHSGKTFRATAIAKDGKGGRGETHFYISVW